MKNFLCVFVYTWTNWTLCDRGRSDGIPDSYSDDDIQVGSLKIVESQPA